MDSLVRKALLGNKEARIECTEKGIVLPCPFCGGEAIIEYDSVSAFEYNVCCGNCGVLTGISEDKQCAISVWNARPAPPIGRCGECEHYNQTWKYCELLSQDPEYGVGDYVEMAPNDYCSYFEQKEEE